MSASHVRSNGGSVGFPGHRASLREYAHMIDGVLRCSLEPAEGFRTIGGFLVSNAQKFGSKPAYRIKRDGRFVDLLWRELFGNVAAFSRFLVAVGVGRGDRVAILSRNRGEMLIVELAVKSMGSVYVPIFPGYAVEQSRHLVADCGARCVVISDASMLPKTEGIPGIEPVVCLESLDSGRADFHRGASCRIIAFDEALREGEGDRKGDDRADRFARLVEGVSPADPCLMMYTSGTSGELKGVVLTHDNILSQRRALAKVWSVGPEDRLLSYLPWHHSFGGIFEKYTALYNAAPMAIDDSLGKHFPLLLENWKAIRPTIYFSVPAVYQALVNHVRLHPEEESEVFHKDLKFVFTAAAPLPESIGRFFLERSIPVIEGWGLTETSPCCTVTDPAAERNRPGVVGHPIPEVEIKISPDGEILVRGPNVMIGYHRKPEETARALDADGWFRTGDLGEIVENALRLIARKDRVFKLLNGERVIPSPIETRLAGMCKYIQHVVIAGAGKGYLAALVFPNYFLIREEFGDDLERADEEIKGALLEAIRELNATHPVKYEQIGAFAVVGRELSVEEQELTPSLKVRVSNILAKRKELIEAIYEPSEDCDCRFLRKIMRLVPESRKCFKDKDTTLDRCHECGLILSADA